MLTILCCNIEMQVCEAQNTAAVFVRGIRTEDSSFSGVLLHVDAKFIEEDKQERI